MKFQSTKDIFFISIIFGTNTFLVGLAIKEILEGEIRVGEYLALILIIAVVILLFWFFFGTSYELSKEDGLQYKSGPLRGKISIDRITEIVKGKTLWVGIKPATARKGLIVKYDKYNEIYISPKTNDSFIDKILELNKNIKITE
jgi:hypothetical protein